MPRRAKGLRLWLRPRRRDGTAAAWFIRDGDRQIATRCREDNRAGAENELLKYVEGRSDVRSKFVYFITTDHPGFPIKIGISESHHMRVTGLQTGLPYSVKVIAVVPTDDPVFERRLHRKFDHLRLRGEWFEQDSELLAFIDALVAERKAA